MDKYERRRLRLKRILEEKFEGSVAALARSIEKSDTYVHRMLYEADRPSRKRIGEDSVDLIKLRLNIDLDEMPQPMSVKESAAPSRRQLQWIDAQEAELLNLFRSTDDQGREHMMEAGYEVPKVLFDQLAAHKAKNGSL